MLTRANPAAANLVALSLRQWRYFPQAAPMSTMRSSISRMLLSTNNSRIVDISHDSELKRGLKTSGDKQEDEDNKSLLQRVRDEAAQAKREQDMSDSTKANLQGGGESVYADTPEDINDMSERIKGTAANQGTYDKPLSASDRVQEMSDRTRGRMSKASSENFSNEESSQENKQSMRKVGNVDRVIGEHEKANVPFESNPNKDPDFYVDTKSDMYERALREAAQMSEKDKREPRPRVGTEDNFDNDPAISISDMEDKIRSVKKKITGGIDHPIENMRESMKQTSQGITETVKGLSEAAKHTVQEATVRTKEFLTGEREDEKPDETQSEVREKTPQSTKPGEGRSSQPGGN